MSTNRTRQIITATLQGYPLMATIEDFDPPPIEYDMEEQRGGRYLPEEMATGLKVLTSKITLQGIGIPIYTAIGATEGQTIELTVNEAGVDQDDNMWYAEYIIVGKLKKIEEKTLKMKDKPVTVLEISNRIYRRIENGVVVIDIDTRTQQIVINGVDILKGARRLAQMP